MTAGGSLGPRRNASCVDMPARRRPFEAGRLIGQIDRGRKPKLALLWYAQKYAVPKNPDMVMRKTGFLKRT